MQNFSDQRSKVALNSPNLPKARFLRGQLGAVAFEVKIAPMSINVAFQGRRFKTKAAKDYDRAMNLLLPKSVCHGDYYSVRYDFYLKNWKMIDYDNLIKQTQDCLVRKGIISDDRKIVQAHINKHPASENKIGIEIWPMTIEAL